MLASPPTTALVVEPDQSDRQLLRGYLAADGYQALAAPNARVGLALARRQPPRVVLLEVHRLGRDATALARGIRAWPPTRDATIIAVADQDSLGDMVGVMDAGIDDFVAKPFGQPELRSRIEGAARVRAQSLIAESPDAVVAALRRAIAASDSATAGHCERVARFALDLGAGVGLSPEELEAIVIGAQLHDVGKIGIPDAVLQKPGALSEADWRTLRQHAEIGEGICRPLGISRLVGPIIRHHHERWDGQGYPDGLSGKEIPIGARIVAVVDAFDAICHDRPYRRARSRNEAIAEIRWGAGTQFDPTFAAMFLSQFEAELSAVG